MANGYSGFRPAARPVVGVDVDILGRPIRRSPGISGRRWRPGVTPTGSPTDPSGVNWRNKPEMVSKGGVPYLPEGLERTQRGGRPSWFTKYKRSRHLGSGTARFMDAILRKAAEGEKGRGKARSGLRRPFRAGASLTRGLTSPTMIGLGLMNMPGNVDANIVRGDNWWNTYMTLATPESEQYADVPGYGVSPEQMYQGAEVPDYDEDFLNNLRQTQELQSLAKERDEAELAGKEDLSMRESFVVGIGNSWDRIKNAIAGRETTPETVAPAIVYDISQMTGKKADAIATGKTKVNGQQMVTKTDSMWDRIMMLMGDTGDGIDWKDAEKTHSMLLAGGILSGEGGAIANSFFGNVMGMARMNNDQKWRISQLATMPRKTYYPVIPEGNALRLDPTRDIMNLHPLDDIPPMYSESKPAESATNSSIIESKEGRKRLDGPDGLRGLWEFKIQTADDTGMGKDWLGMGAEIAAIYTSKYPKLIDMRVMPYTDEMVEMIRTLKGRTSEAAIASGDLEKENWDYWRDTFGNWLPHPSMLKLTAADFGY